MKTLSSRLVLSSALSATLALPALSHADTILGVYAGAGVWSTSIDGDLGIEDESITTSELGIDDENSNFFYIALEHPVPVLPNIRLAHTVIENTGSAMVERDFTWDDITFPANAQTDTVLDLTQTDITLYYEILDNWVSIDFGLNGKMLDGFASVRSQPEVGDEIYEEFDLSGIVPMLYGMARFDLPLSGLYAGVRANYVGYDNNTITDYDIQLGYRFESVLDIGAEIGYRQFQMKLDDFDGSTGDLTYDGPYANLAIHF